LANKMDAQCRPRKQPAMLPLQQQIATTNSNGCGCGSAKQQRKKNCGNMFEVFAFPT